jgi:hypothetical protein
MRVLSAIFKFALEWSGLFILVAATGALAYWADRDEDSVDQIARYRPKNRLRPSVPASVRSHLFTIVLVSAGAVLFFLTALGTIAFLARQDCGRDFGYYGCDIPPTASIPNESDHIAHVKGERRFNMP